MKYLILLLLSSSALADHIEFTVSGNAQFVWVNGVSNGVKHTAQGGALLAAVSAAQKCNCVPVIKTADVKVYARKIITSSAAPSEASSSSSSSFDGVNITMGRPITREDGTPLVASEIGGYELRVNSLKIIIPPSDTDPVQYLLMKRPLSTDIVQVAAFDKMGLYSDFVPVPIAF